MKLLMRDTVTLRRRVKDGVDALGNDSYTTAEEPLPGCSLQRESTDEDTDDKAQAETMANLYAPAGTDLSSVDAVIHDGVTYEVHGDPADWSSPTGRLDHVHARLKVVTG